MRLLAAVQEQRADPAKCFKRSAWNAGAQANYVQLCLNPGPNYLPNPLVPAQADYDANDWVVQLAPI